MIHTLTIINQTQDRLSERSGILTDKMIDMVKRNANLSIIELEGQLNLELCMAIIKILKKKKYKSLKIDTNHE